ncbi:UNVERIFIED_CONTAM: hypothetical protein K2H54_021814 [Gekko kuhli]
MQTMGSFLSDYLEEEKGVPVISKDGLNQLVKEQFPHCEKTYLTLAPPEYPRELKEKKGAIKESVPINHPSQP